MLKNNLDYEQAKTKFHLMQRVMFLDDGVSENELEDMPVPRVFKTNLPLQFLPDDLTSKAKASEN